MRTIESDITIIGGGLTGLAIAYYLRETNKSVSIVEARERLGGRIHTYYKKGFPSKEMGATWLGKSHVYLIRLLQELNINVFIQELGNTAIYEPISTSPHQLVSLPPNNDPSYRIEGGTSQLIEKLASQLNKEQIHTGQIVKSIEENKEGISIKCNNINFQSSIVISTLPPYLFTKTISTSPELPTDVIKVANKTHTWMGESIKVALSYVKPFWKERNTSGTIFSNVGPIPEMYDHSNIEGTSFALKGFLNGSYFSVSKEKRLEIILRQLNKYYGSVANDYLEYKETVWRKEPFTFAEYNTHILPHENNGHPIYTKKYLGGKLLIGGSETANQFPGYMEGAIRSAKYIIEEINKLPL